MLFLSEDLDLQVFNSAFGSKDFDALTFSDFPSIYLNNNLQVNPFDSII
ncbi:hypothetical protein JM83_1651 [Gillisia sp. Hel_I_86]|nr:hypothetical protein JM83_1651 [Gillisia sp. Hel_I_86]